MPLKRTIRIVTRKSPLALKQAEFVEGLLKDFHSGLDVVLMPIVSEGDKSLDLPLSTLGGKGLFVKELEKSLLKGDADLAVHSIKDMPSSLPKGLHISCICDRKDPRDAFISNQYRSLEELPKFSVIGTSSLRRKSQLLSYRPDLEVVFLRGNINTRLDKLNTNNYDGIILAASGLIRLGLKHRIQSLLSIETSLPAPGQGALGIESRTGDEFINNLVRPLHNIKVAKCILAERSFSNYINGGCQTPTACLAIWEEKVIWMRALVGDIANRRVLKEEIRGSADEAELLGINIAKALLHKGANNILNSKEI